MLDALFEVQMSPSHSSEPWRAEDDGSGHFPVEAALTSERRVDGAQLDAFTLCFRERSGAEGVIYLAEPDRE